MTFSLSKWVSESSFDFRVIRTLQSCRSSTFFFTNLGPLWIFWGGGGGVWIVNLILHCVIQGIYPTNYFTKTPLYQIRIFFLLMTFLSCDYFFLSWDIWLEVAGVTSHTRGNSWQKKYRKRISIENVFYWLDRVKQAQDGVQHRGDVWGFHGSSHLDRRDGHGNFTP